MDNPVKKFDQPQDKPPRGNIKDGRYARSKKPPKKITEKHLYNAGLAYLQRFPSSVAHFRRLMTRRIDKSCAYHAEQDREACLRYLDTTVATFQRQGLLDDTAYLRGMVTSLRRRGLSRTAIQFKLQQKGLESAMIEVALRDFSGDMDTSEAEILAATRLCRRKRLGPFSTPLTGTDKDAQKSPHNKQMAALARAGFGYDIAHKALSLTPEEAQQILDRDVM